MNGFYIGIEQKALKPKRRISWQSFAGSVVRPWQTLLSRRFGGRGNLEN
jgi:hypothetical protein